jgi:hypothetical protein
MEPAERKEHIKWNIMQNPAEITIQRTEKIRAGGGFDELQSTVGPMTVRIYQEGTRGDTIKSDTIGTKKVSSIYALLADEKADIQAGPNVIDRFQAEPHGSFQVKAVHPQIVKGVVCGYQADIERVK